MTSTFSYIRQWERVLRWHKRFQTISDGEGTLLNAHQFEDDIFAFFLNCYQLKDWIKNDPSAGKMQTEVEEYVNSSEALSLCADLCNGLKHLTISRSRSRQNPRFGPKVHRVSLGVETATVSVGYVVITDTNKYDAFILADTCVMDWETFLAMHGAPI